MRESVGGLFGPGKEPPRPRLCPSCSTLVGASASRCHQCGASMTFSLAAASRSLSRLMPATSPVTYFILGIDCVLFALSLMATLRLGGGLSLMGGIHPEILDRLGASRPLPFEIAEPWRLVTAVFLHGSLLHIGMNMWVLMDVGPQVEELYGSARYLFLYIFTGAAGYVLSATTGHFSVGASGALLGLIGAMLAITTRRGGAAMQMLRGQLIRWVVYIAVLGIVIRGIDNAAHLGGLAAGFLLGRVMADREPATTGERKVANALGWGTALVVIACFVVMLQNYFRSS